MVALASIVTVWPEVIVTLSAVDGITPPTHVDILLQFPVTAELMLAALSWFKEHTQNRLIEIISVFANSVEKNV